MRELYAFQPECLHELSLSSIFLAGPTPRSPEVSSWRPEAVSILRGFGFDGLIYIPEDAPDEPARWKNEYDGQIDWEQRGLNRSSVILFWVPRELKTMPAFTTNIEWGRYSMVASHRIVLGYPKGAKKMGYLAHNATQLDIPVYHTLADTCKSAIRMVVGRHRLPSLLRTTRHKLSALKRVLTG